jgi:sRNA-binding protein
VADELMMSIVDPKSLRRHLVAQYPRCFKPKGALKLPLKVGIHFDIQAREPWLTMEEILAALKDYTDGPKYLEQCVVGAARYDLDGNPVAKVTHWQESHSRRRLQRLREQWGQTTKPQTLGDILDEAFQRAGKTPMNAPISQNAFHTDTTRSPIPGVIDARTMVDTILHLSPIRAAEAIAARDKTLLAASPMGTRPSIHTAMQNVVRLMREGKKIDAIKEYRAISGQGLKESKDFVESLQGIPGYAPVRSEPYGEETYLVLSSGNRYSDNLVREGKFTTSWQAEAEAKRVCNTNPDDQVILAKVIGQSKSTFVMGG